MPYSITPAARRINDFNWLSSESRTAGRGETTEDNPAPSFVSSLETVPMLKRISTDLELKSPDGHAPYATV